MEILVRLCHGEGEGDEALATFKGFVGISYQAGQNLEKLLWISFDGGQPGWDPVADFSGRPGEIREQGRMHPHQFSQV